MSTTFYCPNCGAAQEAVTKPTECIRCAKPFAAAFDLPKPKVETQAAEPRRASPRPARFHPSRIAAPRGALTSVSSVQRDRIREDDDTDQGGDDIPEDHDSRTVDEIVASIDPNKVLRVQTEDEPIRATDWCRGQS